METELKTIYLVKIFITQGAVALVHGKKKTELMVDKAAAEMEDICLLMVKKELMD